MSSQESVLVEINDPVMNVTIQHPEHLNAPLALIATTQMLMQGKDISSLKKAYQTKYTAYEKMLASKGASEGTRAFLEKRKPVWGGQLKYQLIRTK